MRSVERFLQHTSSGAAVFWAVPLSGYGYVADEQPLPYISKDGVDLTPRFGGEESLLCSDISSLPLPYGKLGVPWSMLQRLFNFFRKRINIYWRNIFVSRCRKDRTYYFLEQLIFRPTDHGFSGKSPDLFFSRDFLVEDEKVIVRDLIRFKKEMRFDYFYACPYAEFYAADHFYLCRVTASMESNFFKSIVSSTGKACWRANRMEKVVFKKGSSVQWEYQYSITSEGK